MADTKTVELVEEGPRLKPINVVLDTTTKPIKRLEKPSLVLVHKGRRYVLSTTNYNEFGRDTFIDLGPRAGFISKRHFALKYENGKLYIKDLGSKNGTFVNSQDIRGREWVELKPGDVVKVVDVEFEVVKVP